MNREQVAKYIKSLAFVLPLFGVAVTPEQVEALTIVAGLIYSIVSVIEAILFKKDK